jgi:hypothetical protein
MMEGVRALPWLEHARDEQPATLQCEPCMKHNEPELRRALGCGWLPPLEDAVVWSGPGHLELTTCPGYTTQLPDVVDVAQVYWWAEHGSLRDRLTRKPSRTLIRGIDALRSAVSALNVYRIRNPKRGN